MNKKNEIYRNEGAGSLPDGYWERVCEVRSAQNFNEFYSHYFSRHLSVLITAALSYTVISPNQVTLSMIFWGLLGATLISQGTPFCYFLGGVSLMMLNVADAVDGELARYLKKTSTTGDYLDRVAHYITNSAAILGMGMGLFFQYGSVVPLIVAVMVEIVYTFDQVARDLLITCGVIQVTDGDRKKAKFQTRIFKTSPLSFRLAQMVGTNMAFFHLTAIFGLIDWMLISANVLALNEIGLTAVYFCFFGLITFVKAVSRVGKINSLYFN